MKKKNIFMGLVAAMLMITGCEDFLHVASDTKNKRANRSVRSKICVQQPPTFIRIPGLILIQALIRCLKDAPTILSLE